MARELDSRRGLAHRLADWLSGPHALLFTVLVGLALVLPTIDDGYILDDDFHRLYLEGFDLPGGPRGKWDLYRFASEEADMREAIERGYFAWWTNPKLHLAFFRPLPSLWRTADHALWGANPIPPHIETVLVYAALIYIAARFYRLLLGRTGKAGAIAAGLAGLLYAVDDSHGLGVAWVANRYTVLACAVSVWALLLHVRARIPDSATSEQTAARVPWLGALVFAIGLLCGEVTLGAWGYLLAFAVFSDKAPLKQRLASLAPYLGVTIAWAIPYRLLQYGAGGSAFYVDPAAAPGEFSRLLVLRLPLLALGKLLGPPSDMWSIFGVSDAKAALLATVIVAPILFMLYRVVRNEPHAATLGVGALVALVPVCAVIPSDRNLFMAGIGAAGVLGIAIQKLIERRAPSEDASAKTPVIGAGAALFVGFMVFRHLVLAAPLLPLRSDSSMGMFNGFTDRIARSIPRDPEISGKTLVVLSTPDTLFTTYGVLRAQRDSSRPVPATIRMLSVQLEGTMIVERTSDRSLEISNERGMNGGPFAWLNREKPYAVGERVHAGDVTAEVLAVQNDFPTRVAFTFDAPLDDQRWVVWQGFEFVEVPVMAVGDKREFASTPLFDAMSGQKPQ